MSKENPTPEQNQKSKEARNKLLLGVLLLVLVGMAYYQFFSGSDGPSPLPKGTLVRAITPSPTPPRPTGGSPAPIISQELDLASMDRGYSSSGGTGRNIFVYKPSPSPPPPPPPSPSPSPTPWPIPVYSLNPGGVFARTADFTLTVFGEKMPQDAQGFIDGRAFPTTVVNATQVRMNVPAEAIRAPGSLTVTVRSKSDSALISNPTPLQVAAPPEPPYKYIGIITLKNVPTAVLLSQSDDNDVHNVKKGGMVGGKWKVINITPKRVEIEDISIKVSHIINHTLDTR